MHKKKLEGEGKSSSALCTRAILLNVPEKDDLAVISVLKENAIFTSLFYTFLI